VTELDHPAVRRVEPVEEPLEPREIALERGWELKEDGAALGAQQPGPVLEVENRAEYQLSSFRGGRPAGWNTPFRQWG
jgi:hypothetical protein